MICGLYVTETKTGEVFYLKNPKMHHKNKHRGYQTQKMEIWKEGDFHDCIPISSPKMYVKKTMCSCEYLDDRKTQLHNDDVSDIKWDLLVHHDCFNQSIIKWKWI